ncbi:MAG: type IV pilin protein [Legionella sp.]|uniref:type IV pilin protein n=1 Tax=Legionella sp. TaxID=459 RepID=UPI002843ADF0|nr:type IV pilin protein [Legionella sp.]
MDSQKTSGFTLIELLIVLCILASFAIMAYPSYISFLLKAHRIDALTSLTQEQMALETCYAQNHSYVKDCDHLPHYPHRSSQGYYLLSLIKPSKATYTLKAIATGGQAKDQHCTEFLIDQNNKKIATDTDGVIQNDCWLP